MNLLTDKTDKEIKAAALRFLFLEKYNLNLLECQEERRGYRGTSPDAVRERWFEHEGWILSNMPNDTEPYKTMSEAVDAGMKQMGEWIDL